jgi:hypothetical protein
MMMLLSHLRLWVVADCQVEHADLPDSVLYTRVTDKQDNSAFVWEWQVEDGSWHPYRARENAQLEAAMAQGESSCTLIIDDRPYSINLHEMQQINRLSRNVRPVRRVPSSATKPVQRRREKKADCRAQFFAENPSILVSFTEALLPVLFDIHQATASSVLRRKFIEAVLKMLVVSAPPALMEVLRSLKISSYLAGMLIPAQETRLIVGALSVRIRRHSGVPEQQLMGGCVGSLSGEVGKQPAGERHGCWCGCGVFLLTLCFA